MKKWDIDEIRNKTKTPPKVSEDYRDIVKYGAMLGGYRVLKDALGQKFIDWHIDRRNELLKLTGWAQEDIEDHMYVDMLYGLNSIKKDKINIIELGIGYAEPSLTFAGLLDNTNLFSDIKNYHIIGVDAELNHFIWSKRQLQEQIKGSSDVIHAALSNYDGQIQFPQSCGNNEYGGYVGSGESVDCIRLSTLLDKFSINIVDVLHIDIQEQELNVIKDSLHLLDKINYMYIGTHKPEVHNDLIEILTSTGLFDIILNIPHMSGAHIPEFGYYTTTYCFDGIIYCKRKNLI